MKNWYCKTSAEVIREMGTNPVTGLSSAEVDERLLQIGENKLEARKKISLWRIFGEQFTDFMVIVLLGASVISFFLGEKADSLTIITIIFINAVMGFIQEFKAEKSLEALKELTAPIARVVRAGKIQEIPAKELVPGDIINLESGDRVPADAS